MIENLEVPFSISPYQRTFVGIRRLGFDGDSFVVDAWTTPPPNPRGSYLTYIPISSREYREHHRTGAAFRVSAPDRLTVYSDHGTPTTITAPPEVVSALARECAAKLPPASDAERTRIDR